MEYKIFIDFLLPDLLYGHLDLDSNNRDFFLGSMIMGYFCWIVLSFEKNMSIYELGDLIGRYKRHSLVKILKEKFGNLKSCRYREMLTYRMSI